MAAGAGGDDELRRRECRVIGFGRVDGWWAFRLRINIQRVRGGGGGNESSDCARVDERVVVWLAGTSSTKESKCLVHGIYMACGEGCTGC